MGEERPMDNGMSEDRQRRDGVELTVGGRAPGAALGGAERERARDQRAWLGLQFVCARAYVRAVKDRDGRGYTGRCPKCARVVRFAIGPGGTSDRFFRVDCGA